MKRALMIIEDEPIHQKNIVTILKKTYGDTYEILVASTGVEAIQQMSLHYKKIDLIFLDINLPDKTGPDIYKEMKARVDQMPKVIMVTAYDQSDEVISAMLEMGAKDYAVKPFRLKEFREKIKTALEGTDPVREKSKDDFIQAILAERNAYYLNFQVDHVNKGLGFDSVDKFMATYKSLDAKNDKSLGDILTLFEEDTGVPLSGNRVSRVLYLEDEEDLLEMSRRLLGGYKEFDVVFCQSLEAAKKAVSESDFDIYVIDLNLKDGVGDSLVEELHQRWQKVGLSEVDRPEIIILSGDQTNSKIVNLAKLGINQYLVKPLSRNTFIEALQESHFMRSCINLLPDYLMRLQSRQAPFRYLSDVLYDLTQKDVVLDDYKQFLPELQLISSSDYDKIDKSSPESFLRSLIELQTVERSQT